MPICARFRFSSSLLAIPRIVTAMLLSMLLPSLAYAAAAATTTNLSISASSVGVGVPTALVATVTDAAGHSVLLGTVNFYDGARPLGSAQIVSQAGGAFAQGTANLKTASFAPGTNSITAVFAGTGADVASTSPARTVTVTGKNPTTTSLYAYQTSGGDNLSATLRAFGAQTPTGSIDFLDVTSGSTLETLPLSGTPWSVDFAGFNAPIPGSGPGALVSADFNGDGILDLAIEDGMNIDILLGNGDGTFKPATTFAASYVGPIVAGDFNNDGRMDFAVLNTHPPEPEPKSRLPVPGTTAGETLAAKEESPE